MGEMKPILLFFFVFTFFVSIFSCNNAPSKKADYYSMKMSNTIIEDNHIAQEHHYVYWKPKRTKETSCPCSVTFGGKNAQFWFDSSCPYYFETKKTGYRTFNMYWSSQNEEICKSNLFFLKQSNGINSFPKEGDFFVKYTVINDSVIKADYKFFEWIEKVNSIAKDSLFPKYIYFHK